MLRLTVFLARTCNVIAGFSCLALVVATATHFAPIVIHSSDTEASAYQAGWGLVAVFAAFSVGFWLAARGLAALALYVLERDEEFLDDYY